MAHRPFSHIARHAERRDMRTHERREIDEHGNESAADRPPSVHGKAALHRSKISVRLDDFTHDEPHEDKRHERGQRTDGGKHPRKIGEHPSPPGIVHQNGKVALPFCLTLHKYLLYTKFVIANFISKKYGFYSRFHFSSYMRTIRPKERGLKPLFLFTLYYDNPMSLSQPA